MKTSEIKASIEAILFAAGEPVAMARLANALNMEREAIEEHIKLMIHDYDNQPRGIKLIILEGSVRLVTKAEYADVIKAALDMGKTYSLSPQMMEVLSVIAYSQPTTRTYVEQVRGVDCSHTLQNLIERGLVEEAGTLDAPGRPKLYATTDEFLRMFGISSVYELPKIDENEITQIG